MVDNDTHINVSVIVPVYNSELSLPELVSRLQPVFDSHTADYDLLVNLKLL